jgi:hypothetical protein
MATGPANRPSGSGVRGPVEIYADTLESVEDNRSACCSTVYIAYFALIEQRRAGLIREHFGGLFEQKSPAGPIHQDVPITLLIAVLSGP